jgi:HK97 family phage portal protein
MTTADYNTAFWSGENMTDAWISSLSASGVTVTPDLAMTLSAMYCGVSTIAYDLATLPAETFKYRDDGGKDRVIARSADHLKGGIADLAYMLRWAPNNFQTATEYFVGQVAQFLLRGRAYAEIVDGPNGFLSQLLPRHPDRVFPERLPNGRLRYKLIEANGNPRYVTQDEMHVVRDLATDPMSKLSRVSYGASAIGTALAAERAAGKFFKSGMTASTVATYTGDMEDEDERALHASMTRYASGVENNFGLLLVPDDVKISNLGIEPEKAQMMQAREWTVYEVARMLKISPRKLMASGTVATYASAYQDAIDHVVSCLRPIAHTFEQAIQRDLILAKDTYFVQFKLMQLLKGDPAARATYYQAAVKNRWMRPSEVRIEEDMNPDPELDRLSESDNQPGKPAAPAAHEPPPDAPEATPPSKKGRATLAGILAVHDNAVRCLRRERVAVEKLAKKHASDVDGWKAALRDFESDHAGFVAEVMRLPLSIARGYCAQHGSEFEARGIGCLDGDEGSAWERVEADDLAALSLTGAEIGS